MTSPDHSVDPSEHVLPKLPSACRALAASWHSEKDVAAVADTLRPLVSRSLSFDEYANYFTRRGLSFSALKHYALLHERFSEAQSSLRATVLDLFCGECGEHCDGSEFTDASEVPAPLSDRQLYELRWYFVATLIELLQENNAQPRPASQATDSVLHECLQLQLHWIKGMAHQALLQQPLSDLQSRLIDLARDIPSVRRTVAELLDDLEGAAEQGAALDVEVRRNPPYKKSTEYTVPDDQLLEEKYCHIEVAIRPRTPREDAWWEAPLEAIAAAARGASLVQVNRSGRLRLSRSDGSMTFNAQFLLALLEEIARTGFSQLVCTEAEDFLPKLGHQETEDGAIVLLRELESYVNEGRDPELLAAHLSLKPGALAGIEPAIVAFWKRLQDMVRAFGSDTIRLSLFHSDTAHEGLSALDVDRAPTLVIGKWPRAVPASGNVLSFVHREARDNSDRPHLRPIRGVEHAVHRLVDDGLGTGPYQTVGVPVGPDSRFGKLFTEGQPLAGDRYYLSDDLESGAPSGFPHQYAIVTVEPDHDPTQDAFCPAEDVRAPAPRTPVEV